MKLTAFLILLLVFDTSASLYSQNTKVSVVVKDVALSKIFQIIEEQSEFRFFYQNEQVQNVEHKSIAYTKESVENILKNVLEDTDLSFNIVDRHIVIYSKSGSETDMKNLIQQKRDVSGKVIDSSNLPLPGVSVVIKGTTTGTITGIDGNF